jgi:hypothetical protein
MTVTVVEEPQILTSIDELKYEELAQNGDLETLLPYIYSGELNWQHILRDLACGGHLNHIQFLLGLNLDMIGEDYNPYHEILSGGIIGEQYHIVDWLCTEDLLPGWMIPGSFISAVAQNQFDMFELLVSHYGTPSRTELRNLLGHAIVRRRAEMVQYLLPIFFSAPQTIPWKTLKHELISLHAAAKPYPDMLQLIPSIQS